MRYRFLFLLLLIYTCSTKRELQLPKIENAEITKVLDVSPAYIFFDETQPDSTLFNRKNLIGTTNWLVNIDKRLTLKQAIPHLQYLQNKRQKASMHKNENAKNYITCNDTNIKNLGFLEFTDVNYLTNDITSSSNTEKSIFVTFESLEFISTTVFDAPSFKFSKINFDVLFNKINESYGESLKIILVINSAMTFQDYITIKNKLRVFGDRISNDEFFY